MYKGKLTIELRSDLCAASGYSFAGVIDTDICYNENGIPYIPARRLKGCLREAAEELADAELIVGSKLNELFGVRGSGQAGKLVIDNAYPKNPNALNDAAKSIIINDYASRQDILELFTSVRAQTQIDEKTNTAEDNSLRYTRVVNQHSAISEIIDDESKNVIFEADVLCSKEQTETLVKVAKALRSIGINRNRGLGAVKCSVAFADDEHETDTLNDITGTGRCTLHYVIRNYNPLVLSDDDSSATESYISGRSVLGMLAGVYLRERVADEEFAELFLKGNVIFSNAYPAVRDDNKWIRSYPAPLYINKTKKTGRLVNMICSMNDESGRFGIDTELNVEDSYSPKGGNQPKKLTGKYLIGSDLSTEGNLRILEPEIEIDYHHSHEDDSILYYHEILKPGQFFYGYIIGDKEKLKKVEELIRNASKQMRFGKSKSAQYGGCELIDCWYDCNAGECLKVPSGEYVAVRFDSDALLMNEIGYVTYYPAVRSVVAEQLGIIEDIECKGGGAAYDAIYAAEVSGYNAKWNMRRQSLPAIGAGSVIVYKLKKEWNGDGKTTFIGARNCDGNGEVTFITDFGNLRLGKPAECCEAERDNDFSDLAREIIELVYIRKLHEAVRSAAINGEGKLCINVGLGASQLGRITLMLKESIQQCGEEDADAVSEFRKRIESIKTDGMRKNALEFIDNVESLGNDNGIKEVLSKYNATLSNDKLTGLLKGLYKEHMAKYMLDILTIQKYRDKQKVKNS